MLMPGTGRLSICAVIPKCFSSMFIKTLRPSIRALVSYRISGLTRPKGLTINIPMPVHAGNASYLMAFNEIILPVTREYKPQIIIRAGGSDPHFNDGLTYLGMTVAGFRLMGDKVREMTEVCGGPPDRLDRFRV